MHHENGKGCELILSFIGFWMELINYLGIKYQDYIESLIATMEMQIYGEPWDNFLTRQFLKLESAF